MSDLVFLEHDTLLSEADSIFSELSILVDCGPTTDFTEQPTVPLSMLKSSFELAPSWKCPPMDLASKNMKKSKSGKAIEPSPFKRVQKPAATLSARTNTTNMCVKQHTMLSTLHKIYILLSKLGDCVPADILTMLSTRSKDPVQMLRQERQLMCWLKAHKPTTVINALLNADDVLTDDLRSQLRELIESQ